MTDVMERPADKVTEVAQEILLQTLGLSDVTGKRIINYRGEIEPIACDRPGTYQVTGKVVLAQTDNRRVWLGIIPDADKKAMKKVVLQLRDRFLGGKVAAPIPGPLTVIADVLQCYPASRGQPFVVR